MKKIFTRSVRIMQIFIVVLIGLYIQKVTIVDETTVTNLNLNKTLDLHAMAAVIEEINYDNKYAVLDSFVGDLTGYGADCPLCSGFLGCTGVDVRDGRTEYEDSEYGLVRIVASSKNLACGSIIQFESSRISNEKVTAIVLDRGVGGTSIDLLAPSENHAINIGRSQIKYDVIRKGWNR